MNEGERDERVRALAEANTVLGLRLAVLESVVEALVGELGAVLQRSGEDAAPWFREIEVRRAAVLRQGTPKASG